MMAQYVITGADDTFLSTPRKIIIVETISLISILPRKNGAMALSLPRLRTHIFTSPPITVIRDHGSVKNPPPAAQVRGHAKR